MNPRTFLLVALGLAPVVPAVAGDWPQYRGPNRDAKVAGVATPALVGDKLYVFTRQGGDEVTRCLDAATGNEVWKDKYPAEPGSTPGGPQFEGPRASPAVADGKVVTFGVQSTLSCLDAA